MGIGAFCFVLAATAAPMVFTDSAAFQSALSAPAITRNFDDVAAGTVIPQGIPWRGITLISNLGGPELVVASEFETTSNPNYLATSREDGQFASGDEIEFSFGTKTLAFGLFLIGSPNSILANDIQLVGGGLSVFNSGDAEKTLPDGRGAFFLGIIQPAGMSSVALNSFGDPESPFFTFHIDDVTVAQTPEPATFAIAGLALAAALLAQRSLRTTR